LNTNPNQPDPIVAPDHRLPAPTHRHAIVKILVTILVLGGFALVFFLVMRSKSSETKKPSTSGEGVTITAAQSTTGDVGVYVQAIGTVTPVYTDSIISQVSGIVTDVRFKEGQIVQKGDPLVEIDPRPYEATLLAAQGALERDQNLLAQAEMDLQRYRVAWARNAIQKQTLDDQEKLVLQDQGSVKNDTGTRDYDQIQVDYCHIIAPITGRVGLRLVDPGNIVQANGTTPLAVITQLSPTTVVFIIPEDNIDMVESHRKDGQKLPVDALDRTGLTKISTGQLIALDNQIDTTTGTVKARALFPNTDGKLFPNQFVNVRLLVTTLHGVTLVPSSAIQHNGQTAFVYVIQNKTAHMQTITAGVTDGSVTEVQGIESGDVVANSGFEKLQDKAKVTIARSPGGHGDATTIPTSRPAIGSNEEPTTRAAPPGTHRHHATTRSDQP